MPPRWPKQRPPLTPEQERISGEFLKLWLEVLPRRFGVMERFNQRFPIAHSPAGFRTTLEIGAGLGTHLRFEKLSPEQEGNYHALEIREAMAAEIRKNFPRVQVCVSDCQGRLDFADGFFDRILAINVFEHLPDLPACIRECRRLLEPTAGRLIVVLPTEGSPAYSLARKISAERLYKKHYGGSYEWFWRREHINSAAEVLAELRPYFAVETRRFFPLPFIPAAFCNLGIGIVLRKRPAPDPVT